MSAWELLLAGLALALLAALVHRLWGGYPARPECKLLAPREAALIDAAAEALYPPGGAVPPSGVEAGIPAYTDQYVAAVPAGTRRLMRLLFLAFEHATLLFPAPGRGGFRRFSALSAEQQRAVLEGWRNSRWFPRRLLFTSLRAILTMGYFAHPPVLRALGLAPYAITPPRVAADLWFPPIGHSLRELPPPGAGEAPLDPAARPPAGEPLALDAPLHPDYAEPPA